MDVKCMSETPSNLQSRAVEPTVSTVRRTYNPGVAQLSIGFDGWTVKRPQVTMVPGDVHPVSC
jgi:hypothetical protein